MIMKKVIIAAAVLALGLGVPPALAASHSGGGSGHSAGHHMGAKPEPEGATLSSSAVINDGGNPITAPCPENPSACPR